MTTKHQNCIVVTRGCSDEQGGERIDRMTVEKARKLADALSRNPDPIGHFTEFEAEIGALRLPLLYNRELGDFQFGYESQNLPVVGAPPEKSQ